VSSSADGPRYVMRCSISRKPEGWGAVPVCKRCDLADERTVRAVEDHQNGHWRGNNEQAEQSKEADARESDSTEESIAVASGQQEKQGMGNQERWKPDKPRQNQQLRGDGMSGLGA